MQMLSSKATLVRKGPLWVQNEHSRTFVSWFKQKVRSQLSSDEDGISDTVRCSRGMDESMVEDLELFVTSSRQYEKGGNDDDDEPNCLGVGEGITIRKRANINLK
ncbi:hypothetical protein ACFE04_027453 [Oxalis oulophora]